MILEILSPEKTLFKGNVEQVTLPGQKGRFMVLKDHAPIISTLVAGTVVYLPEGESKTSGEQTVSVISGFVEVKNNVISVCVEVAPEIVKEKLVQEEEEEIAAQEEAEE